MLSKQGKDIKWEFSLMRLFWKADKCYHVVSWCLVMENLSYSCYLSISNSLLYIIYWLCYQYVPKGYVNVFQTWMNLKKQSHFVCLGMTLEKLTLIWKEWIDWHMQPSKKTFKLSCPVRLFTSGLCVAGCVTLAAGRLPAYMRKVSSLSQK